MRRAVLGVAASLLFALLLGTGGKASAEPPSDGSRQTGADSRSRTDLGVQATTARRKSRRRGAVLRLRLIRPLAGKPRVVVRGPRGFRRVVRSSRRLKGLPVGRYRIIARGVGTRRWHSKPTISKRRFRVRRKTRRVRVTVSYWNAVYRKTKRAKKGADRRLKWGKGRRGLLRTKTAYAPGSVVASAPTKAAPTGYLLRVVGKARRGRGIHSYRVVRASLTEAVPRGSFKVKQSVPLGPGAQASASASPVSCTAGASGSAEVGVGGAIPVEFDARWSLFGSKSVTVTARPTVDVHALATLSGSGSCTVHERLLWKRSLKTVVVWVGPVPIAIVPELSATVGANLSASGKATAEAKVGLSGELRGEASSKGLSVSSHGPTLSRSASVSTEASGNAYAFGKAYFTGKIYGLAGPYVSLTLGPELNADINSNPWWRLGARVMGGVGVKVPALGIDKSKDDIYNGYFPLLDAGGPFSKPTPEPKDEDDEDDGLESIGDELTGSGIASSEEASYTGDPEQFAKLDGIAAGEPTWILTTGRVGEVNGEPSFFASTDFGRPGNSLLTGLAGYETRDAATFGLRVVPTGSTLRIRYVFASEEYPEYVGSEFNDVMGLLVNGSNCARVPGTSTPVAINTINHETNSGFYIDNSTGASGLNTVFDGLTVPIECAVSVTPGSPVNLVFTVADASDGIYDSAIALPVNAISSD